MALVFRTQQRLRLCLPGVSHNYKSDYKMN